MLFDTYDAFPLCPTVATLELERVRVGAGAREEQADYSKELLARE